MKSHFTFTKKQRNGIFLLLLSIAILQTVYFFVPPNTKEITVDENMYNAFQKEIDSLKLIELEARKPKVFPFNPNFITDFKGETLGMNNEQIDRLLAYRKQDKWVNSTEEFQKVTQVSDSLLNIISRYFKFPKRHINTTSNSKRTDVVKVSKTFNQKLDLNKATATQLQAVSGVGAVLSNRIIKYRNKFVGGFIADVQLQDVYGLTPDVINRITNKFTVKTPRQIKKININTATVNELVTIQYIDYEIAHNIIEQRILLEGYKNFEQLLKVKGIPLNKIDIIKLYLSFY